VNEKEGLTKALFISPGTQDGGIPMWRKIIAVTVLAAYCITCIGCYRKDLISVSELQPRERYVIVQAVLNNGIVVQFADAPYWDGRHERQNPGWASIKDSTLTGWTHENDMYQYKSFPLSQVHSVMVRKIDAGMTVLATIGTTLLVAAVVGLIVWATKESCPFIYSYDGQHYWFDGEPYGGATCPALQRTDVCRLDSLKSVQGKYRLLLTNEVNETQHTDEFKLLLIDHSPAVQVIPDADGLFHAIQAPQPLLSATDVHGTDLAVWSKSSDMLWWESNMQGRTEQNSGALRDSVVLCFARSQNTHEANLIANVGTTLWGSQMLKHAEALWGNDLVQWQNALYNPLVKAGLDAWNGREEAYVLHVRVWAGNEWVVRGELLGGGPFLSEDRVLHLNLDGVQGDSLKILLTPAAGFWQLNWFAVDYSPDRLVTAQEMTADSAIGYDGSDLRSALNSGDGIYYTAPDVGQTARLSFVVPPLATGQCRAVFAKVSGYYDIHHEEVAAKQDSILQRIREEPGYYARYALAEYGQWLANNHVSSHK
jgi:hypothetical protein